MSEVISGDAGRIGFLLKGNYSADSTYDFLDVVFYKGSSYVAKKETTGNEPEENNELWQMLVGYDFTKEDITKEDIHNILGYIPTEAFAKKSIFNDTSVSMGRKNDTTSGELSFAFGQDVEASAIRTFAFGRDVKATNGNAHAEGYATVASGYGSHAEGYKTESRGPYSYAIGYYSIATEPGQLAIGRYNAERDGNGDFFIIGNGSDQNSRLNVFRINDAGNVYAKGSYNSSGADYAEFIKEWHDGNPDNEDRVGYFVTVKDGYLHKANEGDYIVGITSGNPSIVGNSDEEYYWRWERDEFNRVIYEEVPEITEKFDENEMLVMDDSGKPVMVETGKTITVMKQRDDYDISRQSTYIERKDRKEWDYVGMVGVVPVRDDGTCKVGRYCQCGKEGIATLADQRGFDTYMVLDRISENVISVILK